MRICSLTAIVVLAVTSLATAETHTIEIGGVDDLLALLPAFGSGGDGDCDDDGDTDVNDLLILIGVWGPCNA